MPTRKLVTRYLDDLALFPDRYHKIGVVVAIVLACALPFVTDSHGMTIANDALIAIVGATGMMILTGFCGQISLGHAAFLALGGYTVALLGSVWAVPFWLALPIAGLVAAAVGLIVGPFALRLEGLYLAIVTLGLLFLVEHCLHNGLDLAFGKTYLSVPMHLGFNGDGEDVLSGFRADGLLSGEQKLYFLFCGIALVTIWCSKNLQRSHTGRAMMAVRDRDMAAEALGVNAAHSKFVAFGLSSFFAGVAGAMYGFAHPVLELEPFNLQMSVEYVAMVVLGGVGTTFGAVWGALAFTVLLPLAEMLGGTLPFPEVFSSEHRGFLIFFPILCVFLVFEPLGLLGIWLRVKRYFAAWPFRY